VGKVASREWGFPAQQAGAVSFYIDKSSMYAFMLYFILSEKQVTATSSLNAVILYPSY
jgi:hypothetical protein